MRLAMLCVMAAAAVSPAHAENPPDGGPSAVGTGAASGRGRAGDRSGREPKSEQTAQIMAGVGTGVSSTLILVAFLDVNPDQPFNKPLMYTGLATAAITPSLGQFYAGEYVTIGMAARAVGAGIAAYALTHYTKISTCDNATMAGSMCKVLDSGAFPLLGLAAIAFVGGMAYDVGDAGPAVQRWNERHGFQITPAIVPGPNGPAAGLSVVGLF